MAKRWVILAMFLCNIAAIPARAQDDEISLFDSTGQPIAYLAEELTIYLWSGRPVAYLDEDKSGGFHVYGFNGKHLGWFVNGLVRDHQGDVVGGVKEAFSTATQYEPYKSYKQYKPYKSYKEYAPYRPYFSLNWSQIHLKLFLLQGGQ
jgi:hypothetical protein